MCATYAPRDPVGEFWRGEISLRTLRVMVEGLPPDSAMYRADPNSRGWTVGDHLAADLWDALNALVMLTSAQFEHVPELPERRSRPGDELRTAQRARDEAKTARGQASWLRGIEEATGTGR